MRRRGGLELERDRLPDLARRLILGASGLRRMCDVTAQRCLARARVLGIPSLPRHRQLLETAAARRRRNRQEAVSQSAERRVAASSSGGRLARRRSRARPAKPPLKAERDSARAAVGAAASHRPAGKTAGSDDGRIGADQLLYSSLPARRSAPRGVLIFCCSYAHFSNHNGCLIHILSRGPSLDCGPRMRATCMALILVARIASGLNGVSRPDGRL